MNEKVQKLENKIQGGGPLSRVGRVAGKVADTVTGGLVKSFLKSIVGNAAEAEGAGTPIDIEKNLRDNISKLDELNKMSAAQAVATMKAPRVPAAGSKVANPESRTGLREKSTGDEKVDDVIRKAGGIPGGSFLGLIQFHDPITGSSLAMTPEKITPGSVAAHLAASRAAFAQSK
jgi:hypothetical protein